MNRAEGGGMREERQRHSFRSSLRPLPSALLLFLRSMSRVCGCVVLLLAAAAFAADDAPTPPAAIQLDFRDRALARELQRMYTIKPIELVTTLDQAVQRDPQS